MTSFKGMDKLLWVRKFEDVVNWVERLEMATKVCNYDEIKLFKIACLNMKGKAKEWYKEA